jgi:hypothetical protein
LRWCAALRLTGAGQSSGLNSQDGTCSSGCVAGSRGCASSAAAPDEHAGRAAVLAAVRPGYEVGYKVDDKYYVNNHLMFKVLVHETNGQYTLSQQSEAELEAAAAVEVRGVGAWLALCCGGGQELS